VQTCPRVSKSCLQYLQWRRNWGIRRFIDGEEEVKGEGKGKEGKWRGKGRAHKLLLNQGPSETCYATEYLLMIFFVGVVYVTGSMLIIDVFGDWDDDADTEVSLKELLPLQCWSILGIFLGDNSQSCRRFPMNFSRDGMTHQRIID